MCLIRGFINVRRIKIITKKKNQGKHKTLIPTTTIFRPRKEGIRKYLYIKKYNSALLNCVLGNNNNNNIKEIQPHTQHLHGVIERKILNFTYEKTSQRKGFFLHTCKRVMSSNMRQKDIRPAPARIEFKGMKFLITDRPSDQTIPNYVLVSIKYLLYFTNVKGHKNFVLLLLEKLRK